MSNASESLQYQPAALASEPSRRDLQAIQNPRLWNGVHSLALRACIIHNRHFFGLGLPSRK